MDVTALKALCALLPASLLLGGSAILFSKVRTLPIFLQLIGAGCLTIVVLAHVCEALWLFPWMGWGLVNGLGHYLDLGSAALGLTLFPIGYLWHAIAMRS